MNVHKWQHRSDKGNPLLGIAARLFLVKFFPTIAVTAGAIYFSHALSKELLGYYQSFWVQLYFVAALSGAGIAYLVLTYSPNVLLMLWHKLRSRNKLLYLLFIFLAGLLFGMLRQWRYQEHWGLGMLFVALFTLYNIVESALSVFRKFTLLIATNIAYTIGFLWLHISFVEQQWSMEQLFWYLLVLYSLRLLPLTISLMRSLAYDASLAKAEVDVAVVKKLWLHLGVNDLLQLFIRWVDKFVVSLFFTASLTAVYINGTIDIPFLPLVLTAVASGTLFQMAAQSGAHDGDNSHRLLRQSSQLLSNVVLPAFVFLFVFAEEFITVVFSEKYLSSVPIFKMSLLVLPVRSFSYTTLLQGRSKGSIITRGALLDMVLALVLMYPLYALMGLPGIALSFVVATYAQAIYYLRHNCLLLHTQAYKLLPWLHWLKVLLISCILLLPLYLIMPMNVPWQNLALATLITGIIIITMLSLHRQAAR